MVRAIMEGRKMQTRRIVKPQPPSSAEVFNWSEPTIPGEAKAAEGFYYSDSSGLHFLAKCPYGQPGDRLWVRETWALHPDEHPSEAGILYRATDPGWDDAATGLRWRPSIHMPRAASRLTLQITEIRIERLQDISEEDSIAEGVAIDRGNSYHVAGHEGQWAHATARGCMETLWGEINGTKSWEANPFVWVISFRRV